MNVTVYPLTFPMLICVLEGLDQPQSLIHRAPHGQIINSDLAEDSLAINDEEAPEDMMVLDKELGAPTSRAREGNTIPLPATVVWSSWGRDVPSIPVGNALVAFQHAIIMGQASGHVGKQGDVQGAQASLLPRCVDPGDRGDRVGTSGCLTKQSPHPVSLGVIRAGVGVLGTRDKGPQSRPGSSTHRTLRCRGCIPVAGKKNPAS